MSRKVQARTYRKPRKLRRHLLQSDALTSDLMTSAICFLLLGFMLCIFPANKQDICFAYFVAAILKIKAKNRFLKVWEKRSGELCEYIFAAKNWKFCFKIKTIKCMPNFRKVKTKHQTLIIRGAFIYIYNKELERFDTDKNSLHLNSL